MKDSFGPYTILSKVGQGGMAEVFKVIKPGPRNFSKPLALKKLIPSLSDKTEFKDMLFQEAQLHVGLVHPNLIQVFDLIEHEDDYGIILEYIDGLSLQALVHHLKAKQKKIPWEVCIHIACNTLKALNYIHSQSKEQQNLDIIHRDISPQNILISKEGVIKLSDLGIAWSKDNLIQTQTGIVKGKVPYLSPEQVLHKKLTQQSDIFSMGSTLYEMLAQKSPFLDQTEYQTLKCIEDHRYTPLSELNLNLPHGLNDIINQALAYLPSNRIPTARDFREKLLRIQDPHWVQHGDEKFSSWLKENTPEIPSTEKKLRHTKKLTALTPSRSIGFLILSALLLSVFILWPKTIEPDPQMSRLPPKPIKTEPTQKDVSTQSKPVLQKKRPLLSKKLKLHFSGPVGTLVYLNGKKMGTIPIQPLQLNKDTYFIMLRSPQGESKAFNVDLQRNQSVQWE